MTRPANGNEDDNTIITHYSDHVIDNENDRSDDNTNDNVSSIDSSEVATFGLPPSYSCIVISDARDCINSGDIQACDNISERNGVGVSKVCTDLPPSYSTVLGHEEEYNVHEIQWRFEYSYYIISTHNFYIYVLNTDRLTSSSNIIHVWSGFSFVSKLSIYEIMKQYAKNPRYGM